MMCSLSTLNEKDVGDIAKLEKDLGKTLLAFSCSDVGAAKVSDNELDRIKALEKKLGISLVAVEA